MTRKVLVAISALALLGATQPAERERTPGRGVLCIATMLYFAKLEGELCHKDSDPEYKVRLENYTAQFDEYLTRNKPYGRMSLEDFKESQGLLPKDGIDLCAIDDARFYETFQKLEPAKLNSIVAEAVAHDGKPTFGDCL